MSRDRSLDLAITGMAARLPAVGSLQEFRSAVLSGTSLLRRLTDAELAAEGVSESERRDESYVPMCGYLLDADRFDREFFGFSERDAALSDPQHRLSLEVAWQALEDATTLPERGRLTTSVYSCSSPSSHARRLLSFGRYTPSEVEQVLMYSERDFLATSIAFKLGLRGQALTVLSACSSSLVALHLAAGALNAGECDQAVVTAASVASPQAGHTYLPGGIMSHSGHCLPFDAQADGTVAGSGAAAIILRRLDDALANGEPVHAVVLGSAVNNDGSDKPGFTAPSVKGQSCVIVDALNAADVTADTIGYLEAHGTGTAVGDPLEWRAANDTYSEMGSPDGSIAVGAVKANVGHLDVAAGLVGLISAVQTLQDGIVPPICGLTAPNPLLEPVTGPLRLPGAVAAAPSQPITRAAVTSLGVGGTNAHVVLESAPARPARETASSGVYFIPVSARDTATLERSCEALRAYVTSPETDAHAVSDLATTQALGRDAFPCRSMLVVESASRRQVRTLSPRQALGEGRPIMLFPGQGTQRPGMAREFCGVLPSFSRRLQEAVAALPDRRRENVRRALLDQNFPEAELARTEFAQPALFAFGWAQAIALRDVGVHPLALAGHSLGEITAACVAEVMDLATAANVVTARAEAMGSCEAGMMVSLGCSQAQAEALLASSGTSASLAALNAVDSVVVAGTSAEIDSFLAQLPQGIPAKVLRTRHAFHTPAMEPATTTMRDLLEGVTWGRPTIALGSNVTGRVVPVGGDYPISMLTEQIMAPVRFAEMLADLTGRYPGQPAVELAPGRVLSGFAERQGQLVAPLHTADHQSQWDAVGQLWTAGVEIDLSVFNTGRRVHGPVYPFRGPVLRPEYPAADSGTEGAPSFPKPVAEATDDGDDGSDDDLHASVAGIVADAWTDQLGARDCRPDDNFIELGGDSLTAVRLARGLRNALGVDVSIAQLLSEPTFGAHVEFVEKILIESLGGEE